MRFSFRPLLPAGGFFERNPEGLETYNHEKNQISDSHTGGKPTRIIRASPDKKQTPTILAGAFLLIERTGEFRRQVFRKTIPADSSCRGGCAIIRSRRFPADKKPDAWHASSNSTCEFQPWAGLAANARWPASYEYVGRPFQSLIPRRCYGFTGFGRQIIRALGYIRIKERTIN